MKDEIKEIYLSNLEWTKTHDNMGGVMGNVVFKDNISYEEYNKLFKSGYFILCDKDCITNLQVENKRLKENAIHNDKVVDKAKWNEMLYKSRCEKANKFIDEEPLFEDPFGEGEHTFLGDVNVKYNKKLKSILNGGDDND